MNLKIKDIINCTHGNLLIGNEEKECENFSKDTIMNHRNMEMEWFRSYLKEEMQLLIN